jgi:hypothetical protein
MSSSSMLLDRGSELAAVQALAGTFTQEEKNSLEKPPRRP